MTKKASSIHFREDEINKKEKNQPEDFFELALNSKTTEIKRNVWKKLPAIENWVLGVKRLKEFPNDT